MVCLEAAPAIETQGINNSAATDDYHKVIAQLRSVAIRLQIAQLRPVLKALEKKLKELKPRKQS
jgi:hypothetical protein